MTAVSPRGSSAPCVFCAIVGDHGGETERGEPADIVGETDNFLALLDRSPVFWGHTLMIPKEHVSTFDELPIELATEWVAFSQRLVRAVEAAMGAEGSLMIMNNVISQSVPHSHLHVIPRRNRDGLRFWLGPRHPYESDEHRLDIAAAIREQLT